MPRKEASGLVPHRDDLVCLQWRSDTSSNNRCEHIYGKNVCTRLVAAPRRRRPSVWPTPIFHPHSCFVRDFALTTVLRSKTGKSGMGSSIVAIIIAKLRSSQQVNSALREAVFRGAYSRYQPSKSAAKNKAPVATTRFPPRVALPEAV